MSNARILADYASGIGTQGATLTVDATNRAVAIGTTNVKNGATVQTLTIQDNNPNIRLYDAADGNDGEITLDNTRLRIEVDDGNVYDNSAIVLRVDGNDIVQISDQGRIAIGSSNNTAGGNTPYVVGYGTAVNFEGGGSVGIGSTNPDYTLSVTGNVGVHTLYQYYPAVKTSARRNLIDNGGMRIAQLGVSTSVTLPITTRTATNGSIVCDRWVLASSMDSAVGMSRSSGFGTDTGHHYALHFDCNGAETPDTSEYLFIQQRMKREDFESLRYGYPDAKESIYSFWCRSNKTGIFTIEFRNVDPARMYVKQVTINSANTWEFKHFIVPAETNAGSAYGIDSLSGTTELIIYHWLDAGTNYTSGTPDATWIDLDNTKRAGGQTLSIMDDAANWFELTGVQWEVCHPGQKYPSAFEYERFEDDLQRCQRYIQTSYDYRPSSEKVPGDVTSLGAHYHRYATAITGRTASVRFATPMNNVPAVTIFSLDGKRSAASDCGTTFDHATNVSGTTSAQKIGSQGFGGILLGTATDDVVGFHFVAFAE